jgi:putative membrane protein
MSDTKTKAKSTGAGLDPDVRFLLANERTLLAWIRTGLALQAGGFALAHFSDSDSGTSVFGILAILFGGFMAVIGYSRFRAADRAIRKGVLPKQGKGPTIEVAIVVLTAITLAVVQAIEG